MHWGTRMGPKKHPNKKEPFGVKVKKAYTTKNLSTAKQVGEYSQKVVDAGKQINTTTGQAKASHKTKNDLSKMTDEELKNKVNRLALETRYTSLQSDQISKGHVNVQQVLDVAGGALAIGTSALAIALTIKQLKDKT